MGLERWSDHTKALPDLKPGQNVFIQNQQGAGKLSKRWDRTGLIIENDEHDKYTVKVDASGRVLQRKMKYLRSFKPMNFRLPGTSTPLPEVKIESDGQDMDTIQDHHEIRGNDELRGGGEEVQMEPLDPALNPPEDRVVPIAPVGPVAPEDPVIRRSTRVPKPSTRYPTTEFDTTYWKLGQAGKKEVPRGDN